MTGNIKLVREERTHSSHLQDTFTAVHDRQFVLRFQLFSELLIVHSVAFRLSTVGRGIETVDSFLTETFGYFFQRGLLLTAQKQHRITVAFNRICIIFINNL